MKTIKFNPKETGWVSIDGDVATVVAHFNNGEKETMNITMIVIVMIQIKEILQIKEFVKEEILQMINQMIIQEIK